MTSLDLKHHLLCILFGICIPPFINSSQDASFRPVYEWSQLEFDYPSEQARQQDISSGNFIPGVAAPIDVDVYYSKNNGNNKIFVSIPRFQAGIPVALATISDKKRDGNPVLTPYPSWQWYQNSKRCPRNRIVSVYRTQIDECDRLWVLDNGRLVDDLICPPQLLVFDLQTDQLLLQYEIPSGQREPRSTLVTPVVDIRNGKCSEAFAYLADCQTFSILVFDLKRRTSWQISDKTMYPYPNYGTYSIAGNSFDLMDGILGAALSPYSPNEDRKLFYHAMSSPTENWVYTSLIRNQSRFQDNPESSPEIFHTYKGQRNTQSAAEATDKDGIMFFGEMSDITLNCWNTRTPYDPQNIHVVASNRKTLQFISGLKIITNRKGTQEIWAMASRFQKVADGTLNANEVNFRIHAGKVEDLLYGSKCRDGASSNSWSGGQGYGLRPRPDQKS